MARFAPDSRTTKGTRHHWQSHFLQRGLQLSPVVIPEIASAAGMREAACSYGFCPEHPLIPHETSLPCLLVKLSDYHLHVFSSAAHHIWEVLPVSIQKAMSLSSFVPHLTTLLYLPQGDKTDTFACLPEKCFIPLQYVIVQLLPFIFRLEVSWSREWWLAWTVGFIVNVPIYCIWY